MECTIKLRQNDVDALDGTGQPCPYSKALYGDPSRSEAWHKTNDYLIKKFQLKDRRLRSPMPIERYDFNRRDLPALFTELGFTRGAEIGVAKGEFSEIMCKGMPNLKELICVDPWATYDDNPRGHVEQNEAWQMAHERLAAYPVTFLRKFSMDAVRMFPEKSLDWVYIDAHHSFNYVICDIVEWSKRVRSGGTICGDDYFDMRWGGVVDAVNAYTHHHRISPWYIFNAYRSVDFMWVNP